ncbi:uncharacterized methyltransferase YdaC-like [Littorina saxatilis]|uniref:Methyltransferase type 11 domain-containing protein n=1 Tax=Littorina saxatilis TaxID=31220 RepID=A0AAN9GJY5_9CAEN
MVSRIKDSLARQIRVPTQGLMGWLTTQILKSKNGVLEKNAVRLSDIQPHHNVLEVGFGPGIGLQHAAKIVKDGPGKVCGVEISTYMLEKASSRLRRPIHDMKMELTFASVENLPFGTDRFDRVYHCNTYYFWPSMQDGLNEIYRVMKPGAFMVTTLNIHSIKAAQSRGLLKYGNPDPVNYMCALELTGFKDVKMEYYREGNQSYQAIFAYLPVKPALPVDELEEEDMQAAASDTSDASSAPNSDLPPKTNPSKS